MAGDAPLLERLAGMTPVAASEVLELIERLREPQSSRVTRRSSRGSRASGTPRSARRS
jgi:hypothetical protein